MKRDQVKKITNKLEEMTALLEEIKKLPDHPDAFDSHIAVEFAWTIRNGIITLQRETDRLYSEIVKL